MLSLGAPVMSALSIGLMLPCALTPTAERSVAGDQAPDPADGELSNLEGFWDSDVLRHEPSPLSMRAATPLATHLLPAVPRWHSDDALQGSAVDITTGANMSSCDAPTRTGRICPGGGRRDPCYIRAE